MANNKRNNNKYEYEIPKVAMFKNFWKKNTLNKEFDV